MSLLDDLYRQRAEIDKKITQIQSECTHPKSAVTEKYSSDTGNYDPTLDTYWTSYHCGLCNKRWVKEH